MFLDESFPSQVDLGKRRVVKYRLLKKGSANDRPNYTLELRIIHVQKLIRMQVDKREAICTYGFSVNLAYHRHAFACKIFKSSARTRFAELASDWLLTLNVEHWLGGPDFQTNEDRGQRK